MALYFFYPSQGVIPNPAEMAVFEELTTELFGVLSEENDTSVPDPEPPTGQLTVVLVTFA
jgi:hypothetical protein